MIYASSLFREIPEVRKWSDVKGEYTSAKIGYMSLHEILQSDYPEFIDIISTKHDYDKLIQSVNEETTN